MQFIVLITGLLACVRCTEGTPSPTGSPTPYPLANVELECDETNQCSNVEIRVTSLLCQGNTACASSDISSRNTIMSGYKSGYNSNFVGTKKLLVTGDTVFEDATVRLAPTNFFNGYNSKNAVYHTSRLTSVEAKFNGYKSGEGVHFHCNSGTKCEVTCLDCSLANFYIHPESFFTISCPHEASCDGATLWMDGNGLSLSGQGANKVLFENNIPDARRLDSVGDFGVDTSLTEPIDESNPGQVNRKLIDNTLECLEKEECANKMNVYPNIYCVGEDACEESRLRFENLYCQGQESCAESLLEGDNVYVTGAEGAQDSAIVAENIYIDGYRGVDNALIRSHDKAAALNIYANGFEAIKDSYIRCEKGVPCQLTCSHRNSCGTDSTFDCSDSHDYSQCTLNCSGKSCPKFLKPCQEFEEGNINKCKKQKTCFLYKGNCLAKSNKFCDPFDSAQSCRSNGKGKYCKWVGNKCIFKMARPIWEL